MFVFDIRLDLLERDREVFLAEQELRSGLLFKETSVFSVDAIEFALPNRLVSTSAFLDAIEERGIFGEMQRGHSSSQGDPDWQPFVADQFPSPNDVGRQPFQSNNSQIIKPSNRFFPPSLLFLGDRQTFACRGILQPTSVDSRSNQSHNQGMKAIQIIEERNATLRLHSTIDGIITYHYTACDKNGIVTGYVRRIRQSDGATIEDRAMTFDDVAGHSPASQKFGH